MAATKEDLQALITLLNKVNKSLISIGKSSAKAFSDIGEPKNLKDLQTLEKSIDEINKSTKELSKTQKQEKQVKDQLVKVTQEELKFAKKIRDAKSKENKIRQENRLILSEANKKAKEQAKLSLGLVSAYAQESKRLNTLRNRYKDLAVQNKENSKEGQRLLKNITKLDSKLKSIDKSVGQNQRSVGNYTESIKDAAQQSGLFTREIAILNQIQGTLKALLKGVTTQTNADTIAKARNTTATASLTRGQRAFSLATNLGSKALKGFKIALASTGVGALVLALGGLVTFLTSTQRGADKLSQATAGITAAFEVLRDRISSIGEGLSLIFSGELEKGFQSLKDSFKGIGDEIEKDVLLATELETRLQKLRLETTAFVVEKARLRKEINKNRLIAEDENRTYEERIDALKTAFKLEEDIANQQQALLKEQIIANVQGGKDAESRAKAEALVNDVINGRTDLLIENLGAAESSVEDLEETNEIIAQLIEAQSQQYRKQKGELTRINGLERERRKNLEQIEQIEFRDKNQERLDEINEQLKQNAELEKAQKEYLARKSKNKVEEIENDTSLSDEANQKEIERLEALQQKEKELLDTSLQLTENFLKKRSDAKLKALDEELKGSEDQQNRLQDLANAGNENAVKSLAIAQKREAEIRKEQERELQRQKRIEAGLTAFKVFGAKTEAGDKNALGNTITDLSVLSAFIETLPTAFDGTIDTGNGGKIDNKGGFLSVLHPNERVVPKKDNIKMGGISNEKLSDIAQMYNKGLLIDVNKSINTSNGFESISELKRINETLINSNDVLRRELKRNRPIANNNTDVVEAIKDLKKSNKKHSIHG